MIKPSNFRTAYCQRAHCEEASFEGMVFWRGLYWHALPFALVIRLFSRKFFRDDLELIRHVGADHSLEEVAEDVERFEYGNRVRSHWLRTGFRIHMSPGRIRALAAKCLKS